MSRDPKFLPAIHRCGRLDPHEQHRWTAPNRTWNRVHHIAPETYRCKGFVLIEGGEGCACCQRPIAECGCYAALAEERRKEWWS
jgi:hypothetical protein